MPTSDVTERSRARRIRVAEDPPLEPGPYDYADAFAITLRDNDTRPPEQLFRAALDDAPWVLRWVPVVHRHVLRFHLGRLSSPDHLFGWRIVRSDADVICLRADGPLLQGVIVGRRVPPSTAVFTTFVGYVRRTPARAVWTLVSPVHRRVAPYLLQRGATAVVAQ